MGNLFYELFGLGSLEFGLNNHSLSTYIRYIVFFHIPEELNSCFSAQNLYSYTVLFYFILTAVRCT